MTDRIPRINQLIKKELGEILLKEFDSPRDALVTITRVETSTNLKQAKVYISVIFTGKQGLEIINTLKNMAYFFQKLLDKRLRMRKVPKIIFLQEAETAQAARIEDILFNLRRQK